MGGGSNSSGVNASVSYPTADTTFTKIFIGGLAWETQRETMSRYFEQFGEILEAVIIIDKHTGHSKGYGFMTFKDPNAAIRACQDPSSVIDGRQANCNLASLGASHRPRPPPANQVATGRFWPPVCQAMASFAYRGTSLAANICAEKSQARGLILVAFSRSPSFYLSLLKRKGMGTSLLVKCLQILDCYSEPVAEEMINLASDKTEDESKRLSSETKETENKEEPDLEDFDGRVAEIMEELDIITSEEAESSLEGI